MINRFGISRGVSPREPLANVGESAKAIEDYGFEALWFIDSRTVQDKRSRRTRPTGASR